MSVEPNLHAALRALRAQLDEALETIRQMREANAACANTYVGVAGLTKSEATIVGAIARTGSITKERLYSALYGDLDMVESPRGPNNISVRICHIRAKLKPYGIEVTTQWGIGFSIGSASINRLRALKERDVLPRVDSPTLAPAHAEVYPQ